MTQTRTAAYDSKLQLTSATNPENGTVTYAYNADGTLNTRTDAKNQGTTYTYDSLERVTKVTHGSDPAQTVTYIYDTNAYDGYGQNGTGRLVMAEYGPLCGSLPEYIEEYSYTPSGEIAGKRLIRLVVPGL